MSSFESRVKSVIQEDLDDLRSLFQSSSLDVNLDAIIESLKRIHQDIQDLSDHLDKCCSSIPDVINNPQDSGPQQTENSAYDWAKQWATSRNEGQSLAESFKSSWPELKRLVSDTITDFLNGDFMNIMLRHAEAVERSIKDEYGYDVSGLIQQALRPDETVETKELFTQPLNKVENQFFEDPDISYIPALYQQLGELINSTSQCCAMMSDFVLRVDSQLSNIETVLPTLTQRTSIPSDVVKDSDLSATHLGSTDSHIIDDPDFGYIPALYHQVGDLMGKLTSCCTMMSDFVDKTDSQLSTIITELPPRQTGGGVFSSTPPIGQSIPPSQVDSPPCSGKGPPTTSFPPPDIDDNISVILSIKDWVRRFS